MKLAFIIDSKKNIGGGEYAQFKFALELAKKGHKVKVFTGEKNFLYNELAAQKNLEVIYRRVVPQIKKGIGLGKIDKMWSNTYYDTIVKNKVKEFKPDWIIGYLRESAIKAQKLGSKLNIKVANFVFESPPWMKEQLGLAWDEELKVKSFAKSWDNTKTAYINSNVLIPNSKLAGKKCKEWIPKAKVSEPVYPGIDAPMQRKIKRDIDIIYIGRLNILKNIHDLLNACKNKTYKIVIVGKGEEEENLRALAKQNNLNVEFKGAVTDSEKLNLLNRSKLLVFPTSFEGFGMPPAEGIAMGCYAICSDIPILREIYKNEVTYFKLHDINELSTKINKILIQKNRNTKGKTLIKKYAWINAVETMEDVLT